MNYHLEIPFLDGWTRFKTGTKGYCQGYMDALRGDYPRSAIRMVDDNGKVIDHVKEHEEVSVGMIAGWPTAGQYERAGLAALEKAKKIRENEAKEEDRRSRRRDYIYTPEEQ